MNKSLSAKEFRQMINLMYRYTSFNMDQWELWKYESSRGDAF